jgi:nucleoside-diphosphate-sugar epimerase
MRVFITGISGFLGRSLAAHWIGRGHTISGSARHPVEVPDIRQIVAMSLAEPFDKGVFRDIDAVVHTAHDFTVGSMEKNIRGAQAWMEAAEGEGVRHQIYLSSYSARLDSLSEYGVIKYKVETLFLEAGHAVLRPGLVVGNGGLFAKQRAALMRTPIMPLLGKGDVLVASLGVDHFLDAATIVLEQSLTGPFNLFYDKQLTMREYIATLKKREGQRIWFLSVSPRLALGLLSAARALHLAVPLHPDQIRAMSRNPTAMWPSDLPALLSGRENEFTLAHALDCLKD